MLASGKGMRNTVHQNGVQQAQDTGGLQSEGLHAQMFRHTPKRNPGLFPLSRESCCAMPPAQSPA